MVDDGLGEGLRSRISVVPTDDQIFYLDLHMYISCGHNIIA